jgi:hypothetical protein
MQLASITSRSVSFSSVPAPRASTGWANLQIVSASPVGAAEARTVVLDTINLGLIPRHAVGGTRVTDAWIGGVNRQSWYRIYQQSADERQAAWDFEDVLAESPLAALLHPSVVGDDGDPVPGHMRIYVDRRAQYLDFASDAVPAGVQGVLDAYAAYAQIAYVPVAAG